MKFNKILLLLLLFAFGTESYSQEEVTSPFKSDFTVNDVRTVLKAVADWQINTPLKHHSGDWTNGALYAGMVEYAGIAGDEKYYTWLKEMAQKLSWNYYVHENPL